eukprot:6082731-Heterocapsa_arctica.AAC.1
MHGGKRDKWSRLRHNMPALDDLAATCDGNHEHLAWGAKLANNRFVGFSTAEEAEYPPLLCGRLAAL